jgi:hypothetical protein
MQSSMFNQSSWISRGQLLLENFPAQRWSSVILEHNLRLTEAYLQVSSVGKDKAISLRARGGPWGCETSGLSHFLDNRLTDGGEVVSLTRRPPFIPRKIPRTHFC